MKNPHCMTMSELHYEVTELRRENAQLRDLVARSVDNTNRALELVLRAGVPFVIVEAPHGR